MPINKLAAIKAILLVDTLAQSEHMQPLLIASGLSQSDLRDLRYMAVHPNQWMKPTYGWETMFRWHKMAAFAKGPRLMEKKVYEEDTDLANKLAWPSSRLKRPLRAPLETVQPGRGKATHRRR